jgi:NAD-dependent deacetylase
MEMIRIDPIAYQNIVVLTGAGVSAASGLPTYRGPDGLWNDAALARLSHGSTLRADPLSVWRFFGERRSRLASAAPNPAHQALADLERRLAPEQSFTLVTMNVDGLHQLAGSQNVLEFHGSVRRTRCLNHDCAFEPFEDTSSPEAVPRCPLCGAILRPDVVLFGEMIDPVVSTAALKASAACDLFLVAGSSGTVWPANKLVEGAARRGARTVWIGLDSLGGDNIWFRDQFIGKAEEILPALFGAGVPGSCRVSSDWLPLLEHASGPDAEELP